MPKVSSCYKVKSNMMHKFYSEPVAALDLRLTKNEASLFGMEANPLDVDVKEEEAFEAKEVLSPDCQDVQGSLSPLESTPLQWTPPPAAKRRDKSRAPAPNKDPTVKQGLSQSTRKLTAHAKYAQ